MSLGRPVLLPLRLAIETAMPRRTSPLLLIAVLAPAARSAIIVVNILDDEHNGDGDCSLREAVLAANTNVAVDACDAGHNSGAGDLILFVPALIGGEIQISQSLVVTQSLSIVGLDGLTLRRTSAPNMIVVDMAHPAHDFALSSLSLIDGQGGPETGSGSAVQLRQVDQATLSDVVIRNNARPAVGRWWYDHPDKTVNELTIEDCTFEDNRATPGGPGGRGGGAVVLHRVPQVTIACSVFRHNGPEGHGPGGALRLVDAGSTVITDSLFVGNTGRPGGAIQTQGTVAGATLSVIRSTFIGNRSGGPTSFGGDIYIESPVNAQIVNSTFYDTRNAIHVAEDSSAAIRHATFIGNTGRASFISSASTGLASLSHTALFGSDGQPLYTHHDGGSIRSSGYNRFQQGDDSCDLVATDPYLADPMLLPLGNYGGAAPVMLPRIDSVLIDVAGTAC
ncbi:right-handed parallel beta-helix repeat-containing protein, partial [Pseudofulvimonas gallinarii]|uniref:right-handed parallel beta-helix repeat-containing protein n=1 Tax=Pseudofulvimonas gallinarii TaxID=634155 RepID=UPI001047B7DB